MEQAMSLPSNAKVFPTSLRDLLPVALAGIPAKVIARATSSTPKAAEKWKRGDNTPSGEALIRLCAEFESVWHVVRQQACRDESDAERILSEFREKLSERRRSA